MFKTISSRLTAHFNPDGGHLHRYLKRKSLITKSLCEDLILHNQIYIPTTDFLTADGLILIVGERGFIDLLESERIKFIRTRGVFGYVRGTGPDGGLAVFGDPDNKRPQDSPIDESVYAAISVIKDRLIEKKKIADLLIQNVYPEETTSIIEKVRRESLKDLKQTILWDRKYEFPNPDLVALPDMEKMQVRVIGAEHEPKKNLVDTLLSLVLYNSDLFLAEKYECQNTSPFYPIGDLLELKRRRADKISESLWTLFEINGIPDLSLINLNEGSNFRDLNKVFQSTKAENFRKWFHSIDSFDQKEILKEYLLILQDVPWIQKLPSKLFRFAVTTGLEFFPVIAQLANAFDTFIIERLFKGKSPKYFIDELNIVSGKLELQPATARNEKEDGCSRSLIR